MPFIRRNFTPIGGSSTPSVPGSAETVPGAPQMFAYRTADATTVVDTAGYFAEIRTLLSPGDLIYRVTIDGAGAVVSAGWHVVITRTATVINVSDTTVLTITNTD
jgi:hypothetical protein